MMKSKKVTVKDEILEMPEPALPSVRYSRLHLFYVQKFKNYSAKQYLGDYNGYFQLDKGSKNFIRQSNNLNSSNKICFLHHERLG